MVPPIPSSIPSISSTSSTSSTTSTSSSTVSSQDPILVAADKLALRNVDRLWKDSFSGNIFSKIVGLFSYAWGYWKASSDDAAHGSTIQLLQEKTKELALALSARGLVNGEATNGKVVYKNAAQQQCDLQAQRHAEKVTKEFYAIFKTRCQQIGADFNSTAPVEFAYAAKHLITVQKEGIRNPDCQGNKIETAMKQVSSLLLDDMCVAFAGQSLDDLTIDGFKDRLKMLGKAFNSSVEGADKNAKAAVIEDRMRTALKPKSEELKTAARAYSDASPANPKVKVLQEKLRTQLQQQLNAVAARVGELCGPSGDNGLLKQAGKAVDVAQTEYTTARQAFIDAYRANAGVDVTSSDDMLLGLDFGTFPQVVLDAHAEFKNKAAVLKAKREEQAELVEEREELAQWTGAIMTGGKEVELRNKLRDVATTARTEATKLSRLMTELRVNNEVKGSVLMKARHNSLQDILNPVVVRP